MTTVALAMFDPDDNFLQKPTDELRKELARAISLTAQHLLRLSAVWAELERRGEDLSDLRIGIAVYLPAIAAGTVSAEAVVAFASRPALLRKVAELPPDEQKRLAAGGTVPVAERSADGTFTHRMLPLASLVIRPGLVRQVFGERCIRSAPEQESYLSVPPSSAAWKGGKVRLDNVTVDRKAGIVRVGKAEASLGKLIEALKKAGAI